jgi:hypothetical protein
MEQNTTYTCKNFKYFAQNRYNNVWQCQRYPESIITRDNYFCGEFQWKTGIISENLTGGTWDINVCGDKPKEIKEA